MDIKLSVIMITYNQEQYIKKAIDSILKQTVLPYEIIIGDDFSTDGTREILLSYKQRYPDLIKLIFQTHNLGIYKNYNSVLKEASGDFFVSLSGDDWIEDEDYFEKIVNFIKTNNLLMHNKNKEWITIQTNYYTYEDGNIIKQIANVKKYLKDNQIFFEKNLSKLVMYNKLFSYQIFNNNKEYKYMEDSLGLASDAFNGYRNAKYLKRIYYLDIYGYVYRIGSGVSTYRKEEINKSLEKIYYYILTSNEFAHLSIFEKHYIFLQYCIYKKKKFYKILGIFVFPALILNKNLTIKEKLSTLKNLYKGLV